MDSMKEKSCEIQIVTYFINKKQNLTEKIKICSTSTIFSNFDNNISNFQILVKIL